MPDTTPKLPDFLVINTRASFLFHKLRFQYNPVSGFPLTCLSNCIAYLWTGANWASQVLGYISLYVPRFKVNSADPSHPHLITDDLVLPSVSVNTLGDQNTLFSELYQHFRERGLPYGLHSSLCTLRPFCSFLNLKTPPQTQHSIRVDG